MVEVEVEIVVEVVVLCRAGNGDTAKQSLVKHMFPEVPPILNLRSEKLLLVRFPPKPFKRPKHASIATPEDADTTKRTGGARGIFWEGSRGPGRPIWVSVCIFGISDLCGEALPFRTGV